LQKTMALKTSNSEKPYVCEYCKKGYTRESTLIAHMCEPKRRTLQKNEKRVRYGFYAFQRFYTLSTGATTQKTYEDFIRSSYYNAFVKFGSFISNVRPLYPERYIDYVVTSGIKLDHWCRDDLYEKYVLEFILKEDVATALERSIKTMVEWADENPPAPWTHYFAHVTTNRAVWHIKDGKMSPWLLLNCKSGKELLAKFTDEQLEMIYAVIKPEHWALRFKRHSQDVQLVKDVVTSSGL